MLKKTRLCAISRLTEDIIEYQALQLGKCGAPSQIPSENILKRLQRRKIKVMVSIAYSIKTMTYMGYLLEHDHIVSIRT
jgi:hypothetical protein